MTSPQHAFAIRRLWLLLAMFLGVASGVGFYTLDHAEGLSYLSSDPQACANCHIMQSQYDSWQKSGHHHVATCADCHLPHSFVAKYIAKAENGYHHSVGFTFQNFHEPIIIKEKNASILQSSCLHCHADVTHGLRPGEKSPQKSMSCVHCHAGVGHGPRAGLGGPYSEAEKQGIPR